MLSVIKRDCRPATERNLRKLMLLQRKPTIEEITIDQLTKSTHMGILTGDEWKIRLARELLDVKNGHQNIEILNKAEATTHHSTKYHDINVFFNNLELNIFVFE